MAGNAPSSDLHILKIPLAFFGLHRGTTDPHAVQRLENYIAKLKKELHRHALKAIEAPDYFLPEDFKQALSTMPIALFRVGNEFEMPVDCAAILFEHAYLAFYGKDFKVPDSLSYARKDDKSFTLYAKIEIENGQYDDFFFYINTPIKAGDFALSKDNNPGHVQYNTNSFKKVKSEFDAFWSESGKLTLTKVDDKGIEGTFNFVASGTVDDVEKKLNITDGKFKITIQ